MSLTLYMDHHVHTPINSMCRSAAVSRILELLALACDPAEFVSRVEYLPLK